MRRPPRLCGLRFVAAFALLAAGSTQAQRVTEIPADTEFDRGIGCFSRFCSATVTALDGNTAIMTGDGAGVLVRNAAGGWDLQQELRNPDSPPTQYPTRMNVPAAVSGDVLLLTGTSRVYNFVPVIYVWQRSGTTWTHTQVLALPRAAGFNETIIASVQVHQRTAAICSIQRDTATARIQTQIDLYALQASGRFQRQAQIIPPVAPQARNRCTLALEGSTLLVADPLANQESGRVLLYERGSSGWTLRRQLTAADSSPGARFGTSIDISGNTIVAGAPQRPNFDRPLHPGAAYVLRRTASTWAQVQLLVKPEEMDEPAPDESESSFGESIAVSEDRLVASWNLSDSSLSRAYLYERRGVWAPVAQLFTYEGLVSVDVLLSGPIAIQTMNVMVSFDHELPELWTLPPRVSDP
ncbi:hypothetical protein HNQ60_005221 [Povalibacter uvarum]|uniref:Uncharacterized protein n=1 Tax=Povalibacter uvarum TaxID=732238 RepID=A0A841HVL5_9GAMM|nr:FG-GAP repeat protein [Povalibacter uvarum]MBB6096299.1 hypothetical protein [Povalibacter uvarum]